MKIIQLTPQLLNENKHNSHIFLNNMIHPTINSKSWMNQWQDIVSRFQLFKFLDLPIEDILAHSWNEEFIEQVVNETVQLVKQHIELDDNLQITIVPALPFPWFSNIDQSIWTNGFTNSSQSIWIAIPADPDILFLRYLLAHELHHAAPQNPIYKLTLDQFPLKDWYKMEGTAEYFSLQLFEDKRWWKESFTLEVEEHYIAEAKRFLNTNDDSIKGPLCFGSIKQQIPYMAGYSFAYNAVMDYIKRYPIENLNQLFEIDSEELVMTYKLHSTKNQIRLH
ncbi:DUF2268 domain-containing putative Zn-dependent protease [Solibacillus isronensis]|uniref:DUF2268 domain-containing putative Zn-dependent protease n=1 Tax=Solibacillus isronensis TaxID=412383 RepID=UPI00203FD21E|nr:DUF2268 domain-containing putative Zn-dependent protease [Solibacillus isronensis]MCM3721049.1 DUF2268 domain-containing protein [Solibacillus isronensis]